MINYMLSLAGVDSRREFHEKLADCMSFPDYYGRNLDAMMDVLTDIGEETCLTICDTEGFAQAQETYSKSILRVLKAAARENPYFHFTIE